MEQIVLFHYSETRAGETAKEFLEGFHGYLMTDGYGGYNKLKDCTRNSIVETAKANNVDIYYYIKYLLEKTPTNLTSDDELEKLCPWNPECKEALEQLHHEHQKAIFDAM